MSCCAMMSRLWNCRDCIALLYGMWFLSIRDSNWLDTYKNNSGHKINEMRDPYVISFGEVEQ